MIEDYYGYIYKTTNLLSNRIYIGQCKGKFRAHYLGSGVIIKKAVRDKGKNNFKVEVLEYCSSLDFDMFLLLLLFYLMILVFLRFCIFFHK